MRVTCSIPEPRAGGIGTKERMHGDRFTAAGLQLLRSALVSAGVHGACFRVRQSGDRHQHQPTEFARRAWLAADCAWCGVSFGSDNRSMGVRGYEKKRLRAGSGVEGARCRRAVAVAASQPLSPSSADGTVDLPRLPMWLGAARSRMQRFRSAKRPRFWGLGHRGLGQEPPKRYGPTESFGRPQVDRPSRQVTTDIVLRLMFLSRSRVHAL